jgi:diaminohydroxyphosphoribosylaminopyrimidine deaminase/5-amino-6-(5-phosphoribosylamino)uracil reductase
MQHPGVSLTTIAASTWIATASLLGADLVDTLLLHRAPILIGAGRTLGDIGLTDMAGAHCRWAAAAAMVLGPDRIERYTRIR